MLILAVIGKQKSNFNSKFELKLIITRHLWFVRKIL